MDINDCAIYTVKPSDTPTMSRGSLSLSLSLLDQDLIFFQILNRSKNTRIRIWICNPGTGYALEIHICINHLSFVCIGREIIYINRHIKILYGTNSLNATNWFARRISGRYMFYLGVLIIYLIKRPR